MGRTLLRNIYERDNKTGSKQEIRNVKYKKIVVERNLK
jgi:hypothetical protein